MKKQVQFTTILTSGVVTYDTLVDFPEFYLETKIKDSNHSTLDGFDTIAAWIDGATNEQALALMSNFDFVGQCEDMDAEAYAAMVFLAMGENFRRRLEVLRIESGQALDELLFNALRTCTEDDIEELAFFEFNDLERIYNLLEL